MRMSASAPRTDVRIRRKVTASGVIWLDGRSYYVSRRLAGRTIPIRIGDGKLVVDVAIPLHKEYSLPRQVSAAPVRGPRLARDDVREVRS